MPESSTPAATDQQIVERLAVEVMKWHKVKARGNGNRDEYIWATQNRDQNKHWDYAEDMQWDPLTDWNHWRQVEEKVINIVRGDVQAEEVWRSYCLQLFGHYDSRKDYSGAFLYAKADLRTRCLALISVLESSHA